MGKAAKAHRAKVQARNERLKKEKDRNQKMQKEFIMNMIKQEQEKGMFENTESITPISGAPTIDTIIEGPSI
jgi:hypothetical protein